MDATEELGKDIRDANQGTRSQFFREESPPTDSEGEQHSLKKFVELQPEKVDAMDIEFPIDQSLAEHADVDKTVDANLDVCADANSNDHANVNMDTNLKVGASVSSAEDSSRDDVVGTNRAHATRVDANVSVDANLEADANMNSHIRMDADANMNSHIRMDADANTSANADLEANAELDVNPHIEGDAKIELDANAKTDAINNSNTNIGVNADVAGQHVGGVIDGYSINPSTKLKSDSLDRITSESKSEENEREEEVKNVVNGIDLLPGKEYKDKISKSDLNGVNVKGLSQSFLWNSRMDEGSESGSEVEQAAFMDELESFFKERSMEFKPPKFYGEGLNLLKLWRAVTRLGGYDQVTSCKLWRQVGESFKPPKTCTTVSWTFRCFYEKALLEYEKSKMHGGELSLPDASFMGPSTAGNQVSGNTTSGRARRDAAARAMQGWHSQRLLGNGEVGDPIIKDKNSSSSLKREKQLKSIGFLKRKKPSSVDRAIKAAHLKVTKLRLDTMVVDIGSPADWVKVNVQKTKDCYEVYALVPGLLREEVRVQSDPAGRLVISGLPEHLDNPWGVTPFKKVVSLPSRIDPHQTSAVVTLHGQLFVRVPFEH